MTRERVKHDRKLIARLFAERLCLVCGAAIPNAKGVYHSHLRLLTHDGECSEFVHLQEKDFSQSKKGRFRPVADVIARLVSAARPDRDLPGERYP